MNLGTENPRQLIGLFKHMRRRIRAIDRDENAFHIYDRTAWALPNGSGQLEMTPPAP